MNEQDYKNNIDNMSDSELEKRYSLNKRRMISNNVFLGAITGISLFAYPPAVLATLGIGAFRIYYINRNNKLIEKEYSLKKARNNDIYSRYVMICFLYVIIKKIVIC